MKAVNDGDAKTVAALLAQGLDPNTTDSVGNTVLMTAVRLGHQELVSLLIDRKASVTRRNPFGGEPMPEQEALQKAIDAKAPADEIKSKLAKYREARKVKEANLAKAQDDLRKVLSVRQEAIASVSGLL